MIFLIGDTHGTIDFTSFMSLRSKARDGRIKTNPNTDYVVVLGDWGVIWSNNSDDREEHKLLNMWDNCPWTTLIVDGNHENFSRLFAFPEVEFGNNTARKISNNILNLKRGEIYNISDQKIFVFGGGLSIDQSERIEGLDWWREELPTTKEMDIALENLKKNKNQVDYIFTHEAPKRFIPELLGGSIDYTLPESLKYKSPLAAFFEHIFEIVDFKEWFCGHYHCDEVFAENDKKIFVIYKDIYRISQDGKVSLFRKGKNKRKLWRPKT